MTEYVELKLAEMDDPSLDKLGDWEIEMLGETLCEEAQFHKDIYAGPYDLSDPKTDEEIAFIKEQQPKIIVNGMALDVNATNEQWTDLLTCLKHSDRAFDVCEFEGSDWKQRYTDDLDLIVFDVPKDKISFIKKIKLMPGELKVSEENLMQTISDLKEEFHEDMLEQMPNFYEMWMNALDGMSILDYWANYRWFISLIVFALPVTVTGLIVLWWNIHVSIDFSGLGASFTYYMQFSSLLVAFLAVSAALITAEIPVYMRHFKFMRTMSLMTAILWPFLFFIYIIDNLYIIFLDEQHYQTDNYTQLMLETYAMSLHWPTLLVCQAIAMKEFSLWIYSFWSGLSLGSGEKFMLGFGEIYHYWSSMLFAINPISIFMNLLGFFFG